MQVPLIDLSAQQGSTDRSQGKGVGKGRPYKARTLVLSDTELAYIAGLLDGEGTFAIHKTILRKSAIRKNDAIAYQVSLSIANTHKPTIDWLQSVLGGVVRKDTSVGKVKHNYSIWYIQFGRQQTHQLLTLTLPYLRIRKREAELIIAFSNRIIQQGGKMNTPTLAAWKQKMADMIQEARKNGREVLSSTY